MDFSRHLDWVSSTYDTDTNMRDLFPMLEWRYIGEGRFGYKHAYQDKITGAVYQTGSGRDEMGVHLTLSGQALNILRSELGGTDDGLSKLIVAHRGRCSRVDLTVNIHNGELTPRQIYQAFKDGNLTARTRNARFLEGINDAVHGDTVYLGSPRSDRYFRAYDKAAEQHIVDGHAWLRLELELRNLRANAALQSSASNGVDQTVAGHMADFLRWDHAEYQQALAGPAASPYELPRKDTNRQRWLLEQVAKALASEINIDPEFKERFWKAVEKHFRGTSAT